MSVSTLSVWLLLYGLLKFYGWINKNKKGLITELQPLKAENIDITSAVLQDGLLPINLSPTTYLSFCLAHNTFPCWVDRLIQNRKDAHGWGVFVWCPNTGSSQPCSHSARILTTELPKIGLLIAFWYSTAKRLGGGNNSGGSGEVIHPNYQVILMPLR